MPRNIEDIIMPERRRSIRNIPIPEGRRKTDGVTRSRKAPQAPVEELEVSKIPPRKSSSKRGVLFSGFIGAVIIIFAALSIFNGATFSYVPKSADLNFNNEVYTAVKTGDSGLLYSVIKLSREKGVEVEATGEDEVSRKASGTIIIYNTSTDVQRLVATTRFESTKNKIYRIQNPVTVPAKGSVEAVVYADQAGSDYNSDPTDFTLPGLKGTAKYSAVYGRSKTPISGGFVGKEKMVSSEALMKAKTGLETALERELWEETQAEVPENFILFPNLATYAFDDLPQSNTEGSSNKATVNVSGTIYAVMFKRSDLSNFLAKKKIALTQSEALDVLSYENLNISFAGSPPTDLLPLNEINFKVANQAKVVWRTDEVALKADLVGRSKRDVPTVLKNYPTIESAKTTLRPFWKSTLPRDPKKIAIKKLSVK